MNAEEEEEEEGLKKQNKKPNARATACHSVTPFCHKEKKRRGVWVCGGVGVVGGGDPANLWQDESLKFYVGEYDSCPARSKLLPERALADDRLFNLLLLLLPPSNERG